MGRVFFRKAASLLCCLGVSFGVWAMKEKRTEGPALNRAAQSLGAGTHSPYTAAGCSAAPHRIAAVGAVHGACRFPLPARPSGLLSCCSKLPEDSDDLPLREQQNGARDWLEGRKIYALKPGTDFKQVNNIQANAIFYTLPSDPAEWRSFRGVLPLPASSPLSAAGYRELVGGRDFVSRDGLSATSTLYAIVDQIVSPNAAVYDVVNVVQEIEVSPAQNIRSLRIGEYGVAVNLLQVCEDDSQNEVRVTPYLIPTVDSLRGGLGRSVTLATEQELPVALISSAPKTGIGSLHREISTSLGLTLGDNPSGTLGLNTMQSRDTGDIEVSNYSISVNPRWRYTINNASRDRARTSPASIAGAYIKNEWTWRIDQRYARSHLYYKADGGEADGHYFLMLDATLEVLTAAPWCTYNSRDSCCKGFCGLGFYRGDVGGASFSNCLAGCLECMSRSLCQWCCPCCASVVPDSPVPLNLLDGEGPDYGSGGRNRSPRQPVLPQKLFYTIPIDPSLFSGPAAVDRAVGDAQGLPPAGPAGPMVQAISPPSPNDDVIFDQPRPSLIFFSETSISTV